MFTISPIRIILTLCLLLVICTVIMFAIWWRTRRRVGGHASTLPKAQNVSALSDAEILNRLPVELKGVISQSGVVFPEILTEDWLMNDVLGTVCQGDTSLYRKILGALVRGSEGSLSPAAVVGDMINTRTMRPGRELPAGYLVQGFIYDGLKRTATGDVLVKAKVV